MRAAHRMVVAHEAEAHLGERVEHLELLEAEPLLKVLKLAQVGLLGRRLQRRRSRRWTSGA